MSREIKFRAWHANSKFMFEHKNIPVLLKNVQDCAVWKYMQYTGINDRYGAEIYEGDILDLGEGTLVVVSWEKETAAFACRRPEDDEPYCDHLYGASLCQIVGNIYENNDLFRYLSEQCRAL